MEPSRPENIGPGGQDLDDLYIPNFRFAKVDSRLHGIEVSAIAYKHATTVEQVERCYGLAKELLSRLDDLGFAPAVPDSRFHLYEDPLGAYTESAVMASAVAYNMIQFDLPLAVSRKGAAEFIVERDSNPVRGHWTESDASPRELIADVLKASLYQEVFSRPEDRREFTTLFLERLFTSEPPLRGFSPKELSPNRAVHQWTFRPGPGGKV